MSPLLYRLSYRAGVGATLPAVAIPAVAGVGAEALEPPGEVPCGAEMLILGGLLGQHPSSLGQTIALLLTFLGIGVIANVVIVYIVAQVLAERKQNQERSRGNI
jgi:hypothetical protein